MNLAVVPDSRERRLAMPLHGVPQATPEESVVIVIQILLGDEPVFAVQCPYLQLSVHHRVNARWSTLTAAGTNQFPLASHCTLGRVFSSAQNNVPVDGRQPPAG
jgi:hypothetical protein